MNSADSKEFFSKSLSDFEDHEDKGEWLLLEEKLIRQNFFRFQPYRFNIYYAACIGLTFFLAIAFSGHYYVNYVLGNKQVVHLHSSTNTERPVKKEQASTENGALKAAILPEENAQALHLTEDVDADEAEKVAGNPEKETAVTELTLNKQQPKSVSDSRKPADMELRPEERLEASDTGRLTSDHKQVGAVADTVAESGEEQISSDSLDNNPVIIRKKIKIVKQDTLFKFDTLHVKPSR